MAVTELDELRDDIEAVRQTISESWVDLASKAMSADDRTDLRHRIGTLVQDLGALIDRLEATAGADPAPGP
jgi:hypothetical protein